MRSGWRTTVGAVAVAVGAAACDVQAIGPMERDTVEQTRSLDATGTFTLRNANGKVVLETWKEPRVHIRAERKATPGSLDKIRVEIRGQGDRVDVVTHQHRSGWLGGAGSVDYHVSVPEGARVEVETTNGAVRVRGTRGQLRASTTNGSVEIEEATGQVEASTTNGAIRAGFSQTPESSWNRFRTTNGSLTLKLPSTANGDLEASTTNGAITSEFELESSRRRGRRHLRGRIGAGGSRFEMRTTNGSVRILKHDGV